MNSEKVVVEPSTSPGHLLRRAQQVHTDAWTRLVPSVTGPQYAVLVAVQGWDDLDQKKAGELASLDKATIAGVTSRLENNGWLERVRDERDRRRRILRLTETARTELPHITRLARHVQEELLSVLPPARRHRFVDQLAQVARIEDLPVYEQSDTVHGLPLANTPGYLLRRAQQFHAGLWANAVPDVTGPQYAVLSAIWKRQVATHAEIGVLASLDSSTTLDVVRRMTTRGWLVPVPDPQDRRSRPVRLAEPAITALRFIRPAVASVQEHILEPLDETERVYFIDGLRTVARIDKEQIVEPPVGVSGSLG